MNNHEDITNMFYFVEKEQSDNIGPPIVIHIDKKYVDSITNIAPLRDKDSKIESNSVHLTSYEDVDSLPKEETIIEQNVPMINTNVQVKVEYDNCDFLQHTEVELKDENVYNLTSTCDDNEEDLLPYNSDSTNEANDNDRDIDWIPTSENEGSTCSAEHHKTKSPVSKINRRVVKHYNVSHQHKKRVRRQWTEENMKRAINAVSNNEISRKKASKFFCVSYDALKKKVPGNKIRQQCRTWSEQNMEKAVNAVMTGEMSCIKASKIFCVSYDALRKKVPGNKIKQQYRTWSEQNMEKAVNAVMAEEMSRKKASKIFCVSYDALKKKVPGNKIKQKCRTWSEQNMEKAVNAVMTGEMSCTKASKIFCVSYDALRKKKPCNKIKQQCRTLSEQNMEKAVNAVMTEEMSCKKASKIFCVSYNALRKKVPGNKIQQQCRTWSEQNMEKAVNAVMTEEMSHLKASKMFCVPYGALKNRVRNKSTELPVNDAVTKEISCNKEFIDKSSSNTSLQLYEHKNCEKCDLLFSNQRLLQHHILNYHLKDTMKCEYCSTVVRFKSWFINHKCYKCDVCGKVISHKYQFCRHLARHGQHEPYKQKVSNAYSKRFECNVCSKLYQDKFFLERHILNVHLNQKFSCANCGRQYSTKRRCLCELIQTESYQENECPVCNRRMIHQGSLTRHLRTIHGAKHVDKNSYACLSCPEHFNEESLWVKHLRSSSHRSKELLCFVCGKKVSRRTHMKDVHHIKWCDDAYFCMVCNKSIPDHDGINEHIDSEIHNTKVEEMRPKCNECGKSFSCISALRTHGKTHSVIKRGRKSTKAGLKQKPSKTKSPRSNHIR